MTHPLQDLEGPFSVDQPPATFPISPWAPSFFLASGLSASNKAHRSDLVDASPLPRTAPHSPLDTPPWGLPTSEEEVTLSPAHPQASQAPLF